MMEVKYTWYVNLVGDVQIYEGDVNEDFMYNYSCIEHAEAHTNGEKLSFDNHYIDLKHDKYIPCKYYIENEFAEMFFTIIDEVFSYGTSGCTDIELSDFLD